jgi:hypothetical protein
MKNQLASIYEQMLLSESEKSELQNPSNDEVGSLKAKQELFGSKPKAVEGPDKAKVKQGPSYEETTGKAAAPKAEKSSMKNAAPAKDAEPEEAKEVKDTEVDPNKEEDEKEEKKEQKNEGITLSAFETLFKKTITEELGETPEEEIYEEPSTEENETEEESSEEDTTEGDEEEGDLISDLRALQDSLAEILAKLEDAAEESELETDSESEEYTDKDFEDEFGEEEAVKEAIEKPKALADAKGKSLQSKQNKVGKIKPKGGKAHTGSVKEDPEPKALGDKKAHLQKGKPEVHSSIKKGDFIK